MASNSDIGVQLSMHHKQRQSPAGDSITVIAHPPERRRRQSVVAPCCCCTCCCCLHSVGGLVGAGIGTATAPGQAAAGVYWSTFAVLAMGLAFLSMSVGVGAHSSGDLFFVVLMALLALPLVQLAAVVVAAAIVAVAPSSSIGNKGTALRGIGSIAAGTIVGALVGLGAMILVGMMLSHH
jgi:hypothetical protein